MAHVQTKDPFGFVGSHVIHQLSSSSSSSSSNALTSLHATPGSSSSSAMTTTAAATETAQEVHGWITRYDARFDSYSLFVPGKGVTAHSRNDIMKLIADPSVLVQNDDDDEVPPPISDTTSRYVGVPVLQPLTDARSAAAGVRGTVQCYLPFADAYRVAYPDGTTADVSEDTVIDSMIRQLTAPAPVAASSPHKRKRGFEALPSPPATVRSVSAPVVSVSVPPPSMMPVSYAAVLGMDSSPVVTPSNILELAARNHQNHQNHSSNSASATSAPPLLPPKTTPPTPQPEPPLLAQAVKSEPQLMPRSSAGSNNIITLIDDEADDVAMVPLELDDVVMVPVVVSTAATGSMDPWTTRTSSTAPVHYIVTQDEPPVVTPLESRSLAYKYVREELVLLLDRPEATAKKLAIQYDILQNPDIKPINSIKRFTEASGLVVLNHLLSTYLAEHDAMARAADVLLLLKIVAMLPIPARKYVADSKVALTIGKLAKPRAHELYPRLPVCILHLAKWIKRKWTEHFSKQEGQEKDVSRSSSSGPASQRNGTRTAPSSSERASRLVDTTPIPRLANRPVLAGPSETSASRPGTASDAAARTSVSLPLSAGGTTSGRKSSLKPDWMRQQETLRRTRFTSEGGQDSAAEYNHYKRIRHQAGSSAAQSLASTATSHTYMGENEQPESAGGVRGTFGRTQRLSFGSRWSVVEFNRDAPPNAVRLAPANRAAQYQQPSRTGRRRSILRRVSKYQGSLDSIR